MNLRRGRLEEDQVVAIDLAEFSIGIYPTAMHDPIPQ